MSAGGQSLDLNYFELFSALLEPSPHTGSQLVTVPEKASSTHTPLESAAQGPSLLLASVAQHQAGSSRLQEMAQAPAVHRQRSVLSSLGGPFSSPLTSVAPSVAAPFNTQAHVLPDHVHLKDPGDQALSHRHTPACSGTQVPAVTPRLRSQDAPLTWTPCPQLPVTPTTSVAPSLLLHLTLPALSAVNPVLF